MNLDACLQNSQREQRIHHSHKSAFGEMKEKKFH